MNLHFLQTALRIILVTGFTTALSSACAAQESGISICKPDDLLNVLQIDADQLPDVDQSCIALSCRRLSDSDTRHLPRLKNLRWLDVSSSARLTDDGIANVLQLPLKGINVSHTSVTEAGILALLRVPTIEHLDLSGPREWSDQLIDTLASNTTVRSLAVTWTRSDSASLLRLVSMPVLTRFRLLTTHALDEEAGVAFRDSSIEQLDVARCRKLSTAFLAAALAGTKLTKLDLSECTGVSDGVLSALGSNGELRLLHLRGVAGIGPKGLEAVCRLQQLETLSIPNPRDADDMLTPDVLRGLARLAKLKVLELAGRSGVNADVLQALEKCSGLEELALSLCTQLQDQDIGALRSLKSLRTLSLMGCSAVTDVGASALESLARLETLYLTDCTLLSDKTFTRIAKLPLKMLVVSGCTGMTSTGIAALLECKTLVSLHMSRVKAVTSETLANIHNLRELVGLGLNDTSVGDIALAYVSKLSKLETLSLRNCHSVSDEGMVELAKLPAIRRIELTGCINVSDNAADWLQKKLPKCELTR